MRSYKLLSLALYAIATSAAPAASHLSPTGSSATVLLDTCLKFGLSRSANVVHSSSAAPRWSEYAAPRPGTVINVATEKDVQVAVKCSNALGLTFLAQGGGNGWANTFRIRSKDVTINLRKLNRISFNADKTQVTVQGGTLIKEAVDAAYANDTQIVTGNCDCIGVMGAMLGGGYGRLMGKHGYMVDNVLSFNIVDGKGRGKTVTTTSDPDLWWALRGAGANFAIVTSATMKAYPTPNAENGAWLGALIFDPASIEQLVTAINDLKLTSKMAIFMYYITSGAPNYQPTVISLPFYLGPIDEARAAFKSILAVPGLLNDGTAWTPYNQVNAGSGPFCAPGSRKPSFGAGTKVLNPDTWRSIWNNYTSFVSSYGGAKVGNSTVLMEAYSLDVAAGIGDASSSYPWRSTNRFNTVAIPWYTDKSFDSQAVEWGKHSRDLLYSTGQLPQHPQYINFGFGDESQHQIYGPNLARLQALKQNYDPLNHFNQWFPLIR